MNAALEWLLTTRDSLDSCHRELMLNAKLAMWMNEAQAAEAIKEAMMSHAAKIKKADVCHTSVMKEEDVHHTTNACVLQQTHQEGMMALEH